MGIVVYKTSETDNYVSIPLIISNIELDVTEAVKNVEEEFKKTTYNTIADTTKNNIVNNFKKTHGTTEGINTSVGKWKDASFVYVESFKYDLGNKMFKVSFNNITESDIRIGTVAAYTPVLVYKSQTGTVTPEDNLINFYIIAKGTTIVLLKNILTVNLNWCAVDDDGNELNIQYLADLLEDKATILQFNATLKVYKGKTSAEGDSTTFRCIFNKITADAMNDEGIIKYTDKFVRTSGTISNLTSEYYSTESYYELTISSYFFDRYIDTETVKQGYFYAGIKSYTTEGLVYKAASSSGTTSITYYFMVPQFTSLQSKNANLYLIAASDTTLSPRFVYDSSDLIICQLDADSNMLMFYYRANDISLTLDTNINDGYFDKYEYVSGTQYSTENKTGYKNVNGYTMQLLPSTLTSLDGTRMSVSTGMKIGFYVYNSTSHAYSLIGEMYIGSPGTGQYTGIYKKTTT